MHKAYFTLILFTATSLSAQTTEKWNLQKCVDYALEHNTSIQQNELQGDIIANNLNQAKLSRIPTLNGSGNHNYNIGRTIRPFTRRPYTLAYAPLPYPPLPYPSLPYPPLPYTPLPYLPLPSAPLPYPPLPYPCLAIFLGPHRSTYLTSKYLFEISTNIVAFPLLFEWFLNRYLFAIRYLFSKK